MPSLPNDVLELLDHAESLIKESDDASVFHTIKVQETEEAEQDEADALSNALDTLQEAVAAAAIALNAVKDHFGV